MPHVFGGSLIINLLNCAIISRDVKLAQFWINIYPNYTHLVENFLYFCKGEFGITFRVHTFKLQVVGLPEYADNTAALAGGLTVESFHRTGDVLKVVH